MDPIVESRRCSEATCALHRTAGRCSLAWRRTITIRAGAGQRDDGGGRRDSCTYCRTEPSPERLSDDGESTQPAGDSGESHDSMDASYFTTRLAETRIKAFHGSLGRDMEFQQGDSSTAIRTRVVGPFGIERSAPGPAQPAAIEARLGA